MNKAQNNPKGILFILLGMSFFSIQDALIKIISLKKNTFDLSLLTIALVY